MPQSNNKDITWQELRGLLKTGLSTAASFAEVYLEREQGARQSEPVPPPAENPIRQRFLEMRSLARQAVYAPQEDLQAVIFYKQARFMEDYTDNFASPVPFSLYYPNYQMMGQEQLRTYFTWRTNARRGEITETSLSYVFVYIYELCNGVGVLPGQAPERLLALWAAYRAFDARLDAYLPHWLRDACLVNDVSFSALCEGEPLLRAFYPQAEQNCFARYAPLADYKIARSAFYPSQAEKLEECFAAVLAALEKLPLNGKQLHQLLLCWQGRKFFTPFQKALYFSGAHHPREKAVCLHNECFFYERGRWIYSKTPRVTPEGRALLGYILRRIENYYRQQNGYAHKLETNPGPAAGLLALPPAKEEQLFSLIDAAIAKCYREQHRVQVRVQPEALKQVRLGAERTACKLLQGQPGLGPLPEPPLNNSGSGKPAVFAASQPVSQSGVSAAPIVNPSEKADAYINESSLNALPAAGLPNCANTEPFAAFANQLTPLQREFIALILYGGADTVSLRSLQAFARERGQMLEVLADGINQLALELLNDNILELAGQLVIYPEYKKQLESVIL